MLLHELTSQIVQAWDVFEHHLVQHAVAMRHYKIRQALGMSYWVTRN